MTDNVPGPLGYDFFADVEGARSIAHTLEGAVRFPTQSTALDRLEQIMQSIPGRLQLVHERVSYRSSISRELASLTQRSKQAVIRARQAIQEEQKSLEPKVTALWAAIEENDKAIEAGGYEAAATAIVAAKLEADTLKARMERAEVDILACFSEVVNEARSLERRVKQLELAAAELAAATFTLQPNESLINAMSARYDSGQDDIIEGILFLTDERLLFEQRQDVTVKQKFLPFGKKKRVEELRLDRPLAQVEEVSYGRRLGSRLSGDTLNVRFKPGASSGEASFDLNGQELAWVEPIRHAVSGEFDDQVRDSVSERGSA